MSHIGVETLNEVLTQELKNKLETLAGVTESDITITERGFKFPFKNSLVANQCRVVKYHNGIILEMRKESDNLIEGTTNKLVFEDVIKNNEFLEVFENVTSIYLSYV